jgi:D-ribose pyranase
MNKQGIIHPELARWVAKLGHHNYLLITDAGYPHLEGIPRIDLGLTPGIPSFIDVLRSIVAELPVEKVWVATEFPEVNPTVYKEFLSLIPENEVGFVGNHEQLKEKSRAALVVVRTGEFTPYANCLIECGVAF